MGREAIGTITFAGQSGVGKLLLEGTEILLRGDIRAKIVRDQITGFAAEGEDLLIMTPDGPLRATIGAKEAAAWVRALAKPVPDLAQKLGITPTTALQVVGDLTDAALIVAIGGLAQSVQPKILLAEISDQATFDAVLAACRRHPDAALWGATRKGKSAFPDAALRAQMRSAGYIDSKSCAVSETLTATRYGRRSA